VRSDVADPADVEHLVTVTRSELGRFPPLEHLTRTTANEMSGRGNAVNAVLPFGARDDAQRRVRWGRPLGETLVMDRFVAAVLALCAVSPSQHSGSVMHSEDVLAEKGTRRGWLVSAVSERLTRRG
jgi:NAD(P)-dependent dehydrogenase (short-subunit alcohol dehydrogenase family)